MNYADLFRVTLPETALEIAALVVLVRRSWISAQGALRMCVVAVAVLLGVLGCVRGAW